MNEENLYRKIRQDLENHLHPLEDKPEETIDSSLKALWLMASGIQKSAGEALSFPLPKLTAQQVAKLNKLINERLSGKALAYITGRQSFMGIELFCNDKALIPRKETEILGKKALEIGQNIVSKKGNVKVFDVCCGSGNLGIAMAHFLPNAKVFASDYSADAVTLAQENVFLLNLQQRVYVCQSDLFSAFENGDYEKKIDLIVCNPPYLSSSKVTKLHSEISMNEPAMAFDGGMLGTKIIQRLIREAPKFLTKEGWVAFEVGVGLGSFLIQIIEKTNLYDQIASVNDELGNIRVICMHPEN